MDRTAPPCLVRFDDYLAAAAGCADAAVHWPRSDVDAALARFPHGERGTAALVLPRPTPTGEAAPGLSLTVQVVPPRGATSAHRHSFWHLYLVVAGSGRALLDGDRSYPLGPGDALYVPPWTPHRFENDADDATLQLYALQNLPQMAALGALQRAP